VERNRWNAVEVEPGDTPQRRILSRARKTRQFRMKTRGSGRGRTNIGDGEVQKRKKSSREREKTLALNSGSVYHIRNITYIHLRVKGSNIYMYKRGRIYK
jgi:hypothetical protein